MLSEPQIYALWRFYVVDMKLYQKDKSVLQRIFKALCEDCPKRRKNSRFLDRYIYIWYNVYNGCWEEVLTPNEQCSLKGELIAQAQSFPCLTTGGKDYG